MPPGDLDTTFDGNGMKAFTFGGNDAARVVLVQPQDGKLIVAGTADGSQKMTVTRLRTDGTPDPAFDNDGTATIDFPAVLTTGAALQADGKIVVAGSTSGDFAVARLNANGSPDTTFGAAGNATVDFGGPTFANAVALQPNGRIVVAGQRTAGEDFAVARLLG